MGCSASKPATDPVPVQRKANTDVGEKKVTQHVIDKNHVTKKQQQVEKHHASDKQPATKDGTHDTDTKQANKISLGDKPADNIEPEYARVDEHARNAPPALKSCIEKLVDYLTQVSSDPRMKVRAIFVWISENIAYDVDGYFGKTDTSSCEAEAVLRNGKSVCEGYANVVELLCREANIPVKKLSGYAKGYSHSAENPFTTDHRTNHAWNAVQLEGKWFLLDSTWGTGHVNTDRLFERAFTEFYFLTEPRYFIYNHFPYMNNDLENSMRWQLLEKPIGLDEFNNLPKRKAMAFALGVIPVSHTHELIRVEIETTVSFKCEKDEDVEYLTSFNHCHNNKVYDKERNTFDQIENGLFTIRIHPHTTGCFELNIFGKKANGDDSYSHFFAYTVKCDKAGDADFTFPYAYIQAQIDRCILIAPLQGSLKQNSAVEFHITSPYLSRIMINKTFLEKNGTSFKGTVKTGSKGTSISVYGSRNSDGSLDGLYKFTVV